MPATATLVNVTPNKLTYLIANAGQQAADVDITADASATPDLVTDCADDAWGRVACARLRKVCRAGLDGLGKQAAAGWTQAEARDLLLGDGSTQAGTALMPRAFCRIVNVDGEITVEADVAAGIPKLVVSAGAASSGYLFIELQSSPGVK